MQFNKLSLFLILIFCGQIGFTQNGTIRGTVYDDITGETLPGVTMMLEGTTKGTMTDFDGVFNMSVPAGIYSVRFSFISYEALVIKELIVKNGEVSLLDNIRLKEASIALAEIVVTAEAVRNSEVAILGMKQKSANVIDGISAVSFRKIGDSDAASSMKRVTGVSVEGGKYVYVRGLGDRYTKTILNGLDIPGLDPDRNTLQMDIFPTNIIDNIVVTKTFTPEMSADFTGGVIDISTKEFPEVKSASISASLAYNPSMHLNPNYLYYKGGKTDFLGFDDGTRAIPATENIPLFSEVVGNPNSEKGQRYREILEGFNPTLAAIKKNSFMDYSIGFSFGNQIVREKATWGFNAALSYKNNTEYYENAQYGRYGLSSDHDVMEMDARETQLGNYGVNNVLLGGVAGLAIKTSHSKIRLNIIHLQNGESKAAVFSFAKNDKGSVFEGVQHNLEYSQRSLTNLILAGKHYFSSETWNIEWKISPTLSKIDDPDIRFTRYELRDGVYKIGTEAGFPERIWRELDERNLAALIHIEKEFTFRGEKARLKFGGASTLKEREYVIRNFQLNVRNILLTGNPDELFLPENLWPYKGSAGRGTTYEAPFIPTNPNQFDANNINNAFYISAELSPLHRLRAIIGLRTEAFKQRYTGQNQSGTILLDNDKVLDDLDFFPSLNLIYSLNESQNLRFSYSKTIARPSFKELSYAEIFDPISGRVFIGGLHPDADNVSGIVYWDGHLQSTDIQNIDFRWEWYGKAGQTISLSTFYKYFSNPIEIVQFFTQPKAFQPRNVGDGQVIGAEVELRQQLDFISQSLKDFNFSTNITWTNSRVKLSETEYQSRLSNARTGQTIEDYRRMAGQAPFIVNAGFSYNGGEKGFIEGFEAGLYYNVQGKTLEIVGIVDRPDIYSRAFHSLNLNLNKSFGKENRFQLGLKIDNILNDSKESVFNSYETEDQYYTRLHQGTTYQLRFGYKI